MRSLSVASAGLLTVALVSCGGNATPPGTRSGPSTGTGGTNSAGSSESISNYGREPGEPERRAIVALVQRYYGAAATANGVRGCSMLYTILEETVSEDYGGPPTVSRLRHKSCALVLSRIFRHIPRQPPDVLARTRVTGVRTSGRAGFVQLSSPTTPTAVIPVKREHNAWKIAALIGHLCTGCAASGELGGGNYPTTGVEPSGAATVDVTRPLTFSGPTHTDSDDGDRDRGSKDDDPILDFGHPAGAADRGAITRLAQRYHAAAVVANGAAGCSMLYSLVAETLAEEPPQIPVSGPRTCASVLSATFEQRHQLLASRASAFRVIGVRVDGNRAYALLGFGAGQGPYMIFHRDRGRWSVETLFEMNLS